MKTEYIYAGLFVSFVLVLALWVLQRFFREMRTLCFCSTVSLMVVVVAEVLAGTFTDNEFLLSVVAHVLFPGFGVAGVLATFLFPFPFDNPSPTYIILSYVLAWMFYSIVFWGIVEVISYVRKKYFRRKVGGI